MDRHGARGGPEELLVVDWLRRDPHVPGGIRLPDIGGSVIQTTRHAPRTLIWLATECLCAPGEETPS